MDMMIDFETLGQKQDCVVLSLGAVFFTEREILPDRFYTVFSKRNQETLGRTVDPATVAWWSKQSPEAQRVLKESEISEVPFVESVDGFLRFVAPHGGKGLKIWSNGSSFDTPILEHILTSLGKQIPWMFWNHRCYRTLKSLFPYVEAGKKNTAHHALEDAIDQATGVLQFYKKAR